MKKYLLPLLFVLLIIVIGEIVYQRTNTGTVGNYSKSQPKVSSSMIKIAATKKPMAISQAIGVRTPSEPKNLKLSDNVHQTEMLKILLSSISADVSTETFKASDWDIDWSGNNRSDYSAKTFYKDNNNKDKVEIQSYLIGSATDYKEKIMHGFLKKCHYPSQDAALNFLKEEGFEIEKPTTSVHGFGSAYWKSIFKIKRENLHGLTYYYASTGVTGCLHITLTDKEIKKTIPFKKFGIAFLFPVALPQKLFEDLEKHNINKILGNHWQEIKPVLKSTGIVSIEKLAETYPLINYDTIKEEAIPAFKVLEGYIIKYIFYRGNINSYEGITKIEQKKDTSALQLIDKSGIKYYKGHYGGYWAKKYFDFEIYNQYPNSYWGQYLFLMHMSKGFTEGENSYGFHANNVILKGEEFIKKHPSSPFHTDILFLLGQAYETLYNQGLSRKACSVYPRSACKKIMAEHENYRNKTMEIYNLVLTLPEGQKYKDFIESSLPRLKTRSKTYCVYYFSQSC